MSGRHQPIARVEFGELRLQFVAQQHAGFAAALLLGDFGPIGVQPISAACFTIGNWTVPASLILQVAHAAASRIGCWSERRQIEIGDADFAGHQLVQQRLEQVFEDGALALVQVDLAVDGVEDRDDFVLLVDSVGRTGSDRLEASYDLSEHVCASQLAICARPEPTRKVRQNVGSSLRRETE